MDQEIIDKIHKAGAVAAQVRREGAILLQKPGASFLEVMDHCEDRIAQLDAGLAWAQMAVNDVAAHFCPQEDDTQTSQPGDLIKIDIGVHIDGYIADNAQTVEVETKESSDLIKASQNALNATLKIIEPGVKLRELGIAQFSEAEKMGFTTIKNLSGHTIEQYRVHAGISIPTFDNKDTRELQQDMQVAIEPFITAGDGFVKDKGTPTIWMMHKDKTPRSPYARKIAAQIKPLNGLPFTNRHLTRKFGKGATSLGLRELHRLGAITPYPPLAERTGAKVAQFEHSIIVGEKKPYTCHQDDEW